MLLVMLGKPCIFVRWNVAVQEQRLSNLIAISAAASGLERLGRWKARISWKGWALTNLQVECNKDV